MAIDASVDLELVALCRTLLRYRQRNVAQVEKVLFLKCGGLLIGGARVEHGAIAEGLYTDIYESDTVDKPLLIPLLSK